MRVRTTPTRSTCLILDTQSWLRTSRTPRIFTNVRRTDWFLKRKGPQALRNESAVFRETFTLVKAMGGRLTTGRGVGVVPAARTTSQSTKEPASLPTHCGLVP